MRSILCALLCVLLLSPADAIAFTSPAWTSLKKHLNTLPVFTCVNAEGEPLGYEKDGQPLAIYFADSERAQQELKTMGGQFPELGLRLIGVGLGDVFQQSTEGTAMLVPSQAALAGAGDEWDSETLPLYTCLAMTSLAPAASGLDYPEGSPTTPLFMCPADAQASLESALAASKANGASEEQLAQLQLVVTGLPTAVDLVVSGKEQETCGDKFQFVAPRTSLYFLREEQQKAQGANRRYRAAEAMQEEEEGGKNLLFPS